MKAAEMRKKSADELKSMIADAKKEQFNLRFQLATGELASPARMRDVRKSIARAKTLLNEKKESK